MSTPWPRLTTGGMNRSPTRCVRDGLYQSSPTRDVEPMDLDLSSDSPKARIVSTVSSELESLSLGPELLSNQRTSSQSLLSFKTASHVISSVVSLKNGKMTSSAEPKRPSKIEETNRPSSTPAFSHSSLGSVNPHSRPQTSLPLSEASSQQFSSRVQANLSDSLLKRKEGYEIPDLSFAKTKKNFRGISCGNEKGQSQMMDQKSELRDKLETDAAKNHSHDKRKINCSILLVPLFMLLLLYLSVTIYFNYCKSLIRFNRTELEEIFNEELFGQHIAAKIIPEKLQLHFNRLRLNHYSTSFPFMHTPEGDCRPLIMSFHGGTGVGKTFISGLISHSFNVVQLTPLNIPLIFPHRSTSWLEAEKMYRHVKESLCHCRINIFMVDEMDKAPDGAVNGLSNAIKYLSSNCSPWYPSVFLFLSNTHASEINLLYKKLLSSSMLNSRKELNKAHFESLFNGSNHWYGQLAQTQQVDAFIPFLPLEKKHAVQCIKRDLRAKGVLVTRDLVNDVMRELVFSEYGDRTFSPTGCKRVSDKVDFVTSKQEENKFKRDVSDL